jgi:hypothetical protein
MFCPKCRTEYRKGFYTCADCEIPLVAELPPELSTSQDPEDDEYDYLHSAEKDDTNDSVSDLDPSEAVLLTTRNNSTEALTIIELLDENGIKTYLESEGNSTATRMLDEQISSYRIFVNKHMLNEARKITDSQNEDSDHEHRQFNQSFKKEEPVWNRGSSLIIAAFFYALSFLPMKESDETMRYVFYGAAISFIFLFLFSFYRRKDSKQK